MLRFSIDPMLDDFISRHRSAEAATTDVRDATIASAIRTMNDLYFLEVGGGLTVSADGEVVRAYGAGPTILARELLRARGYLAVGDGLFTAQNDQNNSGICLRFRRTGERDLSTQVSVGLHDVRLPRSCKRAAGARLVRARCHHVVNATEIPID